ncbi:(2Fe-2S)-binding protein [Virgibacillus proomii]|uniref:(2Fe-2S)-binding protein n=1 Tax=Virgibacillus proomii TaxID=84407 RepID=UPI001C119E3D|nr:(2Fe-2S)-binding protein [Virgibacillus proomii]MBU5266745.1 (2Fe-2S)-binding protein [Virgibacillus proomii]
MNDKEIIVCRCEEVTLSELQQTADTYSCSARELKLRTRAGMGFCGGRTCSTMIEVLAHNEREKTLKFQAPIRPIHFGKLGGEIS